MIIKINAGISLNEIAGYTASLAIEKAQKNSVPDLKVSDIESARRMGINQGFWEFTVKLLNESLHLATELVKDFKPSPMFLHEFDKESLLEYFGTEKSMAEWLSQSDGASDKIESLCQCDYDSGVRAIADGKIENSVFLTGRNIGIELAYKAVRKNNLSLAECIMGEL